MKPTESSVFKAPGFALLYGIALSSTAQAADLNWDEGASPHLAWPDADGDDYFRVPN